MDISKLGIRNLEVFSGTDADGRIKVDHQSLRGREVTYNKMLKALIDSILMIEDYEMTRIDHPERYHKNISIIEKACYPKKWDEIKKLL